MKPIKEELKDRALKIESELTFMLPPFEGREAIIFDSARYSLLAEGKRLRPILFLEFVKMFGGNEELAMPYACALEMIHSYSLIHDDLPCMDNDEYRRGKLTNHMVYGEAMALLAGDALLNRAYEVMLRASHGEKGSIDAMYCIAKYAGIEGMVAGQVIDLEYEGTDINDDILFDMYSKKTCGLIKAACEGGALFANAAPQQVLAAREFAENLGIAFQIIDDILDVEGDAATLGKPIGSDAANGKSTAVAVHGLPAAKRMAEEYSRLALRAAFALPNNEFILELTKYLLTRKN